MYQITIINEANGRDVFQYESKERFAEQLAHAENQIRNGVGFRISDDFSRSVYYRGEKAIGIIGWDLKQAVRGNVKENLVILAAHGAAQMEQDRPVPQPNANQSNSTGKGK